MRRIVLIIAGLLYIAFLVKWSCYAAGGSDSSGYLNAARLISQGRLKVRVTELDVMRLDDSWRDVFMPLGFARAPEPKTFSPSYPLGFPLHLVPFGMLGGWNHAPFYVIQLATLLTILVLYKLAREFDLSAELSAGAAVCLAISPAWINQALQPMSDVMATLWCSIAMLGAMRVWRRATTEHLPWALLSGAAFAIAVWVRPSNILLAPAIAFAMRWRVRPLATAVVASLPFAIPLMAVNRYMYGSALVTGYGGVGGMVSWKSMSQCGPHHVLALILTMTPIIFPTGLLVVFNRRVDGWHRATIAAWFLPFFAFYSAYPICDAWWYLRFLLPVFPPIIIGAALLCRDYVRRPAIRLALIIIVVIVGIGTCRYYHVGNMHDQEITYAHAVHWAQKQLPPNALVATMQISGAYHYYSDKFSARYDFLDPARFLELRAYAGSAGLKWYALVFDWEEDELNAKMPGRWTKIDGMKNVVLLRLDS